MLTSEHESTSESTLVFQCSFVRNKQMTMQLSNPSGIYIEILDTFNLSDKQVA